ncbi:Plasmodium vivax Vir protein, putative [Plasmodium vivax]|uniref:Vir protein, putative n=2 Tax=Plasmodium vivax TaxID=5855 RepID=A0A1G4E535_PLAVI|nr:hypothetical protein PVBG_05687 [Plasmodium vivax Brazil I]SCA60397.1 Plasmodium vivax Vir protein, putative [Plasmodium vivax]
MYLSSSGSSYIGETFGNIVRIWNSFLEETLRKPDHETCKPNSLIVVQDDWRYRKELYEYYVNYDPLRGIVDSYPDTCIKFYRYVESKKELYKYFKERCTSSDENICPKFYAECKQYDPESVLPTLSCHRDKIIEGDAGLPRDPQREHTITARETDSEETDGRMKPFNPPNLSGKSDNVRMYGNVLLGVVATSMTSGALYRFTPLGSVIRNGLGWNNNNMSNINGGDIRLYDYTSESFNPYSGGGEEHYIGYHPA